MTFTINPWTICLLILFRECTGATHWIVTENGLIQPQMDSIYSLNKPFDLVALMEQEKRAILIEDLKKKLILQKEEIDKKEDKETNLEGKIYNTDEDCIAAGKPLTDFDLYAITIVPFLFEDIEHEVFRDAENVNPDSELLKPNCSEVVDLDFSMHAFEHLIGVRDRQNLTMLPEEGLHQAITPIENIEVYGHLVYEALQRNKTSWVNFNMAAYYWRVQGNVANAIECVRRALHFSTSREYKTVALVSLANILHHSHFSEEAAIVAHSAVDITPDSAISHFTLGNIYAVLADYNRSALCFENTLRIQPDFSNAEERWHAVMCHSKLEKALESQHISLQRTLDELREYQKQHDHWLQEHEKLLSEQAPPEVKLEQRLAYEEQKIRESLDGRGQDCIQFEQSGHMVLSCNMRRDAYFPSAQAQIDLGLNMQLLQDVQFKAGRLNKKMSARTGEQCPGT